jgi:serine/threonine-protein kinase
MALWVFVWVVEEHHVASIWELYLAMSAAGFTLLAGALIGTFYLALEPHVRRTRPGMIVSWSRLVAGNLRDPLVARDVLIGCAAAGVIYSIEGGSYLVAERGTGAVPLLIAPAAARVFRGGVYVASALATILVTSILSSLLNLFLLVVLRRLLRYEWAAVLAAATLIGVSVALESATLSIRLPAAVLSSAALFTLISRAGLVATIAASAVLTVLQSYPVTWPLTAWYSKGGLVGLIATSALAVAAFRMTTAPRETRQRGD